MLSQYWHIGVQREIICKEREVSRNHHFSCQVTSPIWGLQQWGMPWRRRRWGGVWKWRWGRGSSWKWGRWILIIRNCTMHSSSCRQNPLSPDLERCESEIACPDSETWWYCYRYYKGKEFETSLKGKCPGDLSPELVEALSIPPLASLPWLISMQQFGPLPSYPMLQILDLNSSIPERWALTWLMMASNVIDLP